MRQLTSLDAQFLALETPRTYGHVGALAIYDPSTAPGGRLEMEDLCRMVGERIHLLPPFRWKLVEVPFGIDHPYWVEDPDFDLDFHIRETAVPPPGDDRKLAETVARIFARPLDRARPLWELYLIRGLPDGRVGTLSKVHHSAVDGVSGAEILSVLLDLSPEGRAVVPPGDEHDRRDHQPGELEMLARGAAGLPLQPLKALRALPPTLPNVRRFPGIGVVPGAPTVTRAAWRLSRIVRGTPDGDVLEIRSARAPRLSFNTRISSHRKFAFGALSLGSVKRLKNELGITVNDVIVGLCATALRQWLIERDELPSEPLVALIPVSVRTKEQVGTFGNRVSTMIVPIPTDVKDPRRRLLRAHEILRAAKEEHRALPASLLMDATTFIPPAVHSRASRVASELMGRLRTPVNVVISNVPGPPIPLYMAGAELQGYYPVSVVVDGVGLNITVMSYRDDLDFGVIGDRESVGETWPILEALSSALDELRDMICGPPRASR
jgi:diacylglycerol O-acyltransferase / wax synthase